MRAIGTIIVAVALVGCSSARSGAGKYAEAADRNASAAPEAKPEPKRAPLPGGLGGDTVHRAYTTPPTR